MEEGVFQQKFLGRSSRGEGDWGIFDFRVVPLSPSHLHVASNNMDSAQWQPEVHLKTHQRWDPLAFDTPR